MGNVKNIFLSLVIFSSVICTKAAIPGSLWQPLNILGAKELRYDYKVQLVASTGLITDSIVGTLYKSGKRYMDSSSVGITVTDGSWFCKLDYDQKIALVYNVRAIVDKMHLSIDDPSRFYSNFSDSVIVKYGTLKVDTSAPDHYLVSIGFSNHNIRRVLLYLNRSTRSVEKLVLECPDPEIPGETDRYSRVYTIYNIHAAVNNDLFELTRFFTIANNKALLSKRYSNYKIKAILN